MLKNGFLSRCGSILNLMIAIILAILVLIIFKYAYPISKFNDSVRVFLSTGEISPRKFDEKGIPISYSARLSKSFISPFYVVHYGLIYSDIVGDREKKDAFHWRADRSIEYWDVPPNSIKMEFFKNSADWIINNIDYSTGQAHLLYKFDWPYRNYPNGVLHAPWWSGLTDGYAIILLLRANDAFQDKRYLQAAHKLYESVITPVAHGGSLNQINGQPWIEEYVDPKVNSEKMSFVLNGMVYGTYGVDAYERAVEVPSPKAAGFYKAISENLYLFDRGAWSDYDAIGSAANIKYHLIHVALLSDLEKITGNLAFKEYREKWQVGANLPGYYWLIYGDFSISKLHFIFFIAMACVISLIIMFNLNWIRARINRSSFGAKI